MSRFLPRAALSVASLLLYPMMFLAPAAADAQSRALWQELPARAATPSQPAVASSVRVFEVDTAQLAAQLHEQRRGGAAARIELPLAAGGFSTFAIETSGTMHPELAAKFPDIQSLRGRDPLGRRLRLDVSPNGVNAMIFADDGVQVIRPQATYGTLHESFARADYLGPRNDFLCEVDESPAEHALHKALDKMSGNEHAHATPKVVSGDVLRNYRFALAGTGEYTTAVCAPAPAAVSCGLAAMVTTMNRVNEVYETDLSVTMTLIPNNNLLVYTNGTTDPYTNNNGSTMLGQNQTNITSVIGAANYDVGHVFSTGGGGVASLSVTCVNTSKARGVTGRGNPTGDPFDIDYVAHEVGHQFAGNHTFNGSAGSCTGGNRNANTAYEPGSGSTIMAYAGICGNQDLQPNSDPYFHAESVREIQAAIAADTCDAETVTTNTPPVITQPIASATPAHVIPARTPFALRGIATDAQNDDLTYTWEQYDRGAVQPGANPTPSVLTGPLVRTFNPTPDPERLIPRLSTLLGGPAALGEVLPTATRLMTFRLTVRDNHPGGGATQSVDTILSVVDTGAAFALTDPNTAATQWTCGTDATVTWNVSGTTATPISCATVDLALSSDGGVTFAHPLATAVPNSGTATMQVPFALGNQTRVQASCSTSIFFDINDANFTVLDAAAPVAADDDGDEALEDATDVAFTAADLLVNDTGGLADVVSVSGAVGGTVSLLDGEITFIPTPDYFGPAGFDYVLSERCGRATPRQSTARVSFELLPVNDAPVLDALADVELEASAGAAGSIADFASVTDFGAPNEADQTVLEMQVTVLADPDSVLGAVAIDNSGTLSYTLTGASGSAQVSVRARDNGGTDNGGVDLSAPRSFTITSAVADVRVSKSNGTDRLVAGATVAYTLTVSSVGNLDVASVQLLDTLPAGLSDATWTCSAVDTVCPQADGVGDIDLTLALPTGAVVTVEVTATVTALAGESVSNTATLVLPDGIVDPTPLDNTDTDTDPVVGVELFADGFESE